MGVLGFIFICQGRCSLVFNWIVKGEVYVLTRSHYDLVITSIHEQKEQFVNCSSLIIFSQQAKMLQLLRLPL